MLQNVSHQPDGNLCRLLGYSRLFYLSVKQRMSQPDRTANPVSAKLAFPQAQVPIELFRQEIQRNPNVTKPERPPRAMPQQVYGKQTEMIFRRQNANLLRLQR